MTGLPTLVVCRSSADGLIAAQRLASQRTGGSPDLDLSRARGGGRRPWPLGQAAGGAGCPRPRRVPRPLAHPVGGVLADPADECLPTGPTDQTALRVFFDSSSSVTQPTIEPTQEHL